MKSKNVIVLLLSLTLSMVMNARPHVESDIGLTRGSPCLDVTAVLISYNATDVEVINLILEPVVVRTSEPIINDISIQPIVTGQTVRSKCRDVDLKRTVKSYLRNITEMNRSRSNTIILHDDGSGGSGNRT